ncbi:FecCD family ABC transporter permease [Corynebacterium sp. Marseille-Q2516]
MTHQRTSKNLLGVAGGIILVLLLAAASLFLGSKSIDASRVWEVLLHADGSFESTVVRDQRIPRTILVILVGMALGVAGALMQSLTRNPLADPGVLGVNAGASIAVVTAVAVAGVTSIWFYLWFAFAGAAAASVAVYVLGGAAGRMATPARLALAGVAISMAISALVQMVILSNQDAFNEFRLWAAGSVEGRGWPIITAVVGFIVLGLLVAFASAPGLNALALGDEAGAALGVKVNRLRVQVMVAVTLLAGAATAAVGPIMFIGLGVPSLARAICGPDQRWVVPLSAVAAPVVMLVADIAARLIIAPAEVQTGIITAILGGPVFIAIIRLRRIEAL